MKLKSLLITLAAAVGLTTAASAATPVVTWNGDLANNSTRDGFTMTFGSNAAASSGSAVFTATTSGSGNTGVAIDWDSATFSGQTMTVLVKYSGFTQSSCTGNTALLGTYWGSSDKSTETLVNANGSMLKMAYNVTSSASGNNGTYWTKTAPTEGLMRVTFSSSGTHLTISTGSDGAWTTKSIDLTGTDSNLKKSASFYGLKIGGSIAGMGSYYRPGMTVSAVSILDSDITDDELTAFTFPETKCVTITDARWGNIGDAVNGGCATEANQMSAATTFTVSLADTANICTRQIGANGTLALKKVRLVSRNDSNNATTSITVTQGTVTGTTTDKAEVANGIIYQSDRTAKDTRKYWDFTFATPLEIDTSKSFTLYINGGARCIKVANPTMCYSGGTWSPAVEFIGDYTFEGSKPKFFLNYYDVINKRTVDGWLNFTCYSPAVAAQTTNGISFAINKISDSTNYRNDSGCVAISTVDFSFAGTYADVYGVEHASIYEEMRSSLATTLPINDNIFKSGIVHGANANGTAVASGLDASTTYVMYFGFGVYRSGADASGFKLDSANCGEITSLDYVVSKANSSSSWPTTASTSYTSFSAGQSVCADKTGLLLVRAVLKPKSDGTVSVTLPGGRSGMSFVAIAEMAALDNTYTATVTTDTDFSELEWSPEKPTGGFKANAVLTINNTAAATVTFDEDVTVSKIKVVNDSGKVLGMTFDSSKTVSAKWDFSGASGGISFLSLDGTELAKCAVAGAPYSYWAISGTITGSPTVTGPTMPTGYSVTSEVVDGYGLRLIVTAPSAAQFGSININFAGGRNSQTTVDTSKVGSLTTAIGGYPVVGTSWNDLAAANQTATSVPKYINSDGTLVTDASITLTATGVNNPYTSGAANNMLITGYMDDSGSPVVTINNIPFAKYRVIVYRATDSGSTTFSAAQIGTTSSDKKIYYGPTSSDTTGGKTLIGSTETVWGKSDYRTSYIEGVNYIVSDVLEGTAGSATAYIYSHKHSGRAGVAAIQIVEVGQYVAMDFAATVTESKDFSALNWSPAKPAAGFPEGANFTLTNSSEADTTTVTIDSAITAGKLTIVSATKELKLANFGANMTATSYDFSNAAGGVGLDVTGGWTADDTFKSHVRDNETKVIFYGSGDNGATVRYNSDQSVAFKSHLVFNGGTHIFQYRCGNSGNFAVNATDANPTLLVKDGTTLKFEGHDLGGYSQSVNVNAICKIEDGGKLYMQQSNGTVFYRQRFTINPGGELYADIPDNNFCLHGGTAAESTAQIYVPASENGIAYLKPTTANGTVYLHSQSPVGFGITVGAGSTLDFSAKLKSANSGSGYAVKKYGAGTWKFSGDISEFTGTITIDAGIFDIATATAVSCTPITLGSDTTIKLTGDGTAVSSVIAGSGSLVRNGSGTVTLSGVNTYTGTTTVEAGTLKVAENASLGTGNYTVNSGATLDLGTHRPSTAKLATSAGTVCVTLTDDEQTKFDGMEQFEILNTVDDATLGALRVFDADGNEHASTFEVAGGKVKVTKLDEKTQPFNVTASGEKNWTAAGWTDSSDPVKNVILTDWDLKVGANLEVAAGSSATMTLDRAIQLGHFNVTNDGTLAIAATGDNTLTIEALAIKNTGTLTIGDDAVSAPAINDSESTGATTLNFAPGTANITAGANTVVRGGGTGTLTIGANKTATINDGVWAGTVAFDGLTSTLRYAGTMEIASVPYTSGNDGTIVYAAPFANAGEYGFQFAGAMTRKFEDGFSVTATRFVTGNNANITQNFTQDGGSITVTGDTQAGENTSSILMAHWNSTVNYALKGGSLTAENAAIQFGLDGKIYMTVGGGDGTATLRAKGIWQKSRASASTLTLKNNGVIELGSDGLQFTKTNPSLTLEGGTIKAYADTTIAVAHADGMKVTGATTIDLNGNDVTVSAVITDSGSITVNDSSADADGTLTLTGANTYTGTMTVESGTLKVDGNFSGSYAIGANGSAQFTVDTTVADYKKPTVTTLNGTVTITAKTTTAKAITGASFSIATLPAGCDPTKVTATLIDKDTNETIATDLTIDSTGAVTVKLRTDDFTLTPSASSAFTWQVGSLFDDSKAYTDFGNVWFKTTEYTTDVTIPSFIKAFNVQVGGTYTFGGSPMMANTVTSVDGTAATFTNDVAATDVAVTNGTATFASLAVDKTVTVSNATFGAAVMGPSMRFVRLTVTATQGGAAPAVGEFRLYRGSATTGYSTVDWPTGTKVTEAYGSPATVNMTVTKENSGYPCAVGTKNEQQPGCLIDGYYGNSSTAVPYTQPSGYLTYAFNKWWMNGKSSPWTVTIEFPYPVATFSGCNFCLSDNASRNPTAWTIEVSNDGENWTKVSEETAATWTTQHAWKGGDEDVPAFLNNHTTPTTVNAKDGATIVAEGNWTAALNASGNVTFEGVAGKNLTLDAASTSSFAEGAKLKFDLNAYDVSSAGKQYVVAGPTDGWPEVADIEVVPASFSLYKDTNGYYVVVESGNYWVGDQEGGVGTWDLRNTKAWATNATETTKKLVWLNGGAALFTRDAAVTIDADADIAPTAINITSNDDITVTFKGAVSKLASVPFNINSTNVTVTIENDAEAAFGPTVTAVEGHEAKFVKKGEGELTLNTAGFTNIVVEAGTLKIGSGISLSGKQIEVKSGATLDPNGQSLAGATIAMTKSGKLTLTDVPTLTGTKIIITDADTLVPGTNYKLIKWTNWPDADKLSYGMPTLVAEGYTGAEIRLVPGVYDITLQCRSAAQVAHKPLVILPIGDSITEGLNNKGGSGKNYRIPLYNKLSLAGYNVKSVGYWDRSANNGITGSYDPSGTIVTNADWIFHSGKGSMRAGIKNNQNGMVYDQILNDVDIAGNPDAVLLHVGINDAYGTDASTVFTYLTNMVIRTVKSHPKTTFIVSTPMCCAYGHDFQKATAPGESGEDKKTTFNKPLHDSMVMFMEQAAAGQIEGLTVTQAAQIRFADLYTNVMPGCYADEEDKHINDGSDHCHPNWLGHELMAQTWFDQIVAAFPDAANPNGNYDAEPEEIPATDYGAEKNVPAEYRNGYVLARRFNPEPEERLNSVISAGEAIPYDYVNPDIDDDQCVSKVAYFFEYVLPTTTTNLHRYVWADMDAFDTTVQNIGVPTNNHQVVVNNFHVYGNHPAVWNIDANDNTQKGFVEFTPYGVSSNDAGVEGGPAKWCNYSWNDAFGDTLNYGCMQVHRMIDGGDMGRAAQVVFAYNAFTSATTYPGYDFGIGNFSQSFMPQSMDWTFMQRTKTLSSTNLTYRSIEIWVKVAPTSPLTAEVTGETDFSKITWTDAKGVTWPNLTGAYNYVLTGTGTTTLDAALSSGATVTVSGGTLKLANADYIGETAYTVADGATLLVTASGLTASKVTNNGTIRFEGGTEANPITITGDANFGFVTLGADTYVLNTVDNNHVHVVKGDGATSCYALNRTDGGVGFESAAFTNLTIVSDCEDGRIWIERMTYENIRFVANRQIHLNDLSPTVLSLKGTNSVTRAGSETLTINVEAACEFAGASTVPFTIGGTSTMTLSGAYTGALTVNSGASVLLKGSAVPSSITGEGTVTFDYGADTSKTVSLASTGAVKIDSGTVIFSDYRGAVTLAEGAKVGYTVNINDCGEFTPPEGVAIGSVELYKADGTKITTTTEGGKLTYEWEITGDVCYWDYEFNEAGRTTTAGPVNSGSEGTAMTFDGDRPSTVKGKEFVTNIVEKEGVEVTNISLRVPSRPWRNVSSWPAAATFVMYGKMVASNNTYQIVFGSTTYGNHNTIFLATGDASKDEVVLCRGSGQSSCTTLCTMTVPNATTADHLYAFTLKTVDGNTLVDVYLDGELLQEYPFTGEVTLGPGFQIASPHGGVVTGYARPADDDPATLDWLRVYNTELTAATLEAYAKKYPYVSPKGSFQRTVAADGTWDSTDAWTNESTSEKVDKPVAASTVKIEAEGTVTLKANLSADETYEAIKITGDNLRISQDSGTTGKIKSSGRVTAGANVTFDYDAFSMENTALTIKANKTVTFDLSMVDMTQVFDNKTIDLTGYITQEEGSTITFTPPAQLYGRTLTAAIDPTTHHYVLTVTVPDRPFVFTIAQGEDTGTWTWGDQTVSEEIVTNRAVCRVEKAGTGVGKLWASSNITNYTVTAGTMMFTNELQRAMNVTVDQNATFDLNGLNAKEMNLTLAGGKVTNSGSAPSEGDQIKTITLTANSEINVPNAYQVYAQSYSTQTTIALGGHTLTKTGSAELKLVYTAITGTGKLQIDEGTVYSGENTTFDATATLAIGANGTYKQRDNSGTTRTTTVANITGEGGTLNVEGTITGFNLTGTLTLANAGTYGTITNAENAVANIGTRLNYYTFSGAGTVKAKFATDPEPGQVTTIFKVADSATTGVVLLKSDDSVIDSTYYTLSNGTVTFKKEAKIGTTYYFVLADAISAAGAKDTVVLATNVTGFSCELAKDLAFDGDIWEITGDGFTGSGKLTIAGGYIGVDAITESRSLIGGRYPAAKTSTWTPETGYHYVEIASAESDKYYQIVKGETPTEEQKAYPVVINDEPAGTVALNETQLEKIGCTTESTPEQVTTALATTQSNDLTKYQNLVLGLDGAKTEYKDIPVVAPVQGTSPTEITFKLGENVKVDTTTGAKVTYKVYGSTDKSSWEAVSSETAYDATASVTLPDSGVKYYKFDVIVTPAK